MARPRSARCGAPRPHARGRRASARRRARAGRPAVRASSSSRRSRLPSSTRQSSATSARRTRVSAASATRASGARSTRPPRGGQLPSRAPSIAASWKASARGFVSSVSSRSSAGARLELAAVATPIGDGALRRLEHRLEARRLVLVRLHETGAEQRAGPGAALDAPPHVGETPAERAGHALHREPAPGGEPHHHAVQRWRAAPALRAVDCDWSSASTRQVSSESWSRSDEASWWTDPQGRAQRARRLVLEQELEQLALVAAQRLERYAGVTSERVEQRRQRDRRVARSRRARAPAPRARCAPCPRRAPRSDRARRGCRPRARAARRRHASARSARPPRGAA